MEQIQLPNIGDSDCAAFLLTMFMKYYPEAHCGADE